MSPLEIFGALLLIAGSALALLAIAEADRAYAPPAAPRAPRAPRVSGRTPAVAERRAA